MKLSMTVLVRTFLLRLAVSALVIAIAGGAIHAQTVITGGKIQIDDLDRLASKAAEVVNVNLDERLLRIIPNALSKTEPDQVKAREIIAGLKGVYVKRFEFDIENAYTDVDVAGVRQQLRAPGWSRIVEVRSRREGRNVEVYILNNGSKVDGLTVLAFEPKELTIVNIVGTIDLEKLSQLEGQFGLPELELERDAKAPQKK